ncbi:MAG: hypothetical protein JWP14_3366 [Frankiales bacterium]|nr:hypothetical protein [Frankiales bacterium]
MTLGEVVRRLEEVSRQLTELVASLNTTYLRKDVYEVRQKVDEETMKELRVDLDSIVEQQRQNRRLALSGIVLPILTAVVAALILAALLP